MDSIKTVKIDSQTHPVALRRSIKVPKNSSPHIDISTRTSSTAGHAGSNHYSNYEAQRSQNQLATSINIETAPQRHSQAKHIKLIIGNKRDTPTSCDSNSNEQDLYTLIDEFQSTLNSKDCDTTSCSRFKLLSFRLTQTLLERMNMLKKELAKKSEGSVMSHPSSDKYSSTNESNNMDKSSLMNLVTEKEKRIQDLERLVEDQKALRMQDASLVEEKAARIKEWVANKLKELENQNRQLRDQNRKHKETVESLTYKLATMSPISSPRRINIDSASVQYIDQSSPVGTIDVNKSLKARRPLLKKQLKSLSSSSEDENQNLVMIQSSEQNAPFENNAQLMIATTQRKSSPNNFKSNQCESPVYDSVTVEQIGRKNSHDIANRQLDYQPADKLTGDMVLVPPPPPLHQTDKWELQLYNLADQTFSTLLQKNSEQADNKLDDSFHQFDSLESRDSTSDTNPSRKSLLSLKIDLISLVKPSFTTIDGEQVVDWVMGSSADSDAKSTCAESSHYSSSNDLPRKSSQQMGKLLKDSVDSPENESIIPSLFDSPLKSKSGKDRVLRTQSIRKNTTPEKLYDVITTDLVKRGYLFKPGALKNHNRWIVLKNFHLYSYKSESDEISKSNPNVLLKLEPSCHVQQVNQTGGYPFRISFSDKSIQLVAESAQTRDEWIRLIYCAINFSDMTHQNQILHEGFLNVARQGQSKKCHAKLVGHIVFFLKSLTDSAPSSYVSVKGARIREITDNYDEDFAQHHHDHSKSKSNIQDCSLAIYPKYSLSLDPIYITLESQQETDEWFYFLSLASGIDQTHGTPFEQMITRLMINNSILARKDTSNMKVDLTSGSECCWWKDHSIVIYDDKPITQPLTSLPNETLRSEALELFKSLLLFTQVPIEPVAIDYHVCLLQNCLGRFLKHPELRNEFYAQLIKQSTYVKHQCGSSNSSSDTNCNSRSSVSSPNLSECQFITDVSLLDPIGTDREFRLDANLSSDQARYGFNGRSELLAEDPSPPSQNEIVQVMQILAVTVSLNLPRGRMVGWLIDHLSKFANPETNIGKYALYTLKAIDRTAANGARFSIPSRTEIIGILLRNPYEHSEPHSLPVRFCDGSYLVVEADGSTTVEEFISGIGKRVNIRPTSKSDFYLFADDPSGTDLHILEPHRKVLDIVGWWEQSVKTQVGLIQKTKTIRFICKKRLILQAEEGETQHERLLIVHQMNQEVVMQRIQLGETLTLELNALIAQLVYGDFDKFKDPKSIKCMLEKISANFLPRRSSQSSQDESQDVPTHLNTQLVSRWQQLAGKTAQDCVRIYLNCFRRSLKLCEC